MANKNLLTLSNFNLGGISDSKYQGIDNSMATLVGFDLHSEPGILKVNQRLVSDPAGGSDAIDGFIKTIVPCSDGNTYFFSSTSGKIWKRDPTSLVYALMHTAIPGAGSANITGATEFNGYLYWATESRVGRWQIGTTWAGANDAYAIFTNTDDTYHPMLVKNNTLYIGDKYYIAQINSAHAFTANALDIPTYYRIKSLGQTISDLLIGTISASNVASTQIFRWNTWAVSWSTIDQVPEVGINSFLASDNEVYVQVGTKGNMYRYNGYQLQQFKRIPGDWTSTKKAVVHPDASANFGGQLLFGLSNSSGNPALQGVYTLGAYSSNYPRVLSLDYIISAGVSTGIEIGSIAAIGDDVLVSWKNGSNYGVDRIDWANKYSGAYMESRMINVSRDELKDYEVTIGYRTVPTGTSISIYASKNHEAYSLVSTEVDAVKKSVRSTVNIAGAATLQIKIATTANGNNAPEIESVDIRLKT